MWVEVGVTLVVLVVSLKLLYRWSAGRCTSMASMEGKTVIVTGATAGIGKETARDLASRGARVILACRNLDKAEGVARELRIATSNKGQLEVRYLDTSDLASVRRFADRILREEQKLHVLINNAGIVGSTTQEVTEDGLELTMATNHYGHFLLTNLLLGLLKQSAPSRIINVTSHSHCHASKFNPDSLNFEHNRYSPYRAYSQSKLCNVLFTVELGRKLEGTGVTTNSVHPGLVNTEIYKNKAAWYLWISGRFSILLGKDSRLGAQTIIHLAVSEEVEGVSGKYFVDCKETESSKSAQSKKFARQLWEASEVDVKLQPEERHF